MVFRIREWPSILRTYCSVLAYNASSEVSNFARPLWHSRGLSVGHTLEGPDAADGIMDAVPVNEE